MKICSVRVDLFHADGRKYGYDEVNSRFLQFGEKRLIHMLSPQPVSVMYKEPMKAYEGINGAFSQLMVSGDYI